MPAKRMKVTARRSGVHKTARSAGVVLRETWDSALKSLSSAEAELEKQLRAIMKGKGIGGDAAAKLRHLGTRLQRERRRLAREIETRMSALQARVRKERKSFSHMVDDTVRKALAALNIPSRQEIGDLTRKVDELTRKIDGFSARVRRPAARKPRVATPAHA